MWGGVGRPPRWCAPSCRRKGEREAESLRFRLAALAQQRAQLAAGWAKYRANEDAWLASFDAQEAAHRERLAVLEGRAP